MVKSQKAPKTWPMKSNDVMIPPSTSSKIDETTRQVLSLLQQDGRRSYSSIARELKISESAVRSRVSFLEKNEHLRFIAVVDPAQIGYGCWAMLGITVVPGASPHSLAMEFSDIPSAIWVGVIGGKFDLLVEVWTETSAELQDFLEKYCHAKDQIASVDTMVGMRIYKWGAPQL
tara:strand:+ start:4333 stop:4854 length:522 start_codon:yes stop_codon:yes gene_type:complete